MNFDFESFFHLIKKCLFFCGPQNRFESAKKIFFYLIGGRNDGPRRL